MKESIKPFMLPQTEMKPVHGHTRIVLTNSASGHIVKDIESENTFQSQILADLFDNIPFLNQQNSRSWSDMVGGLLLFRDSIPVGSRFMPAGNVMIGNGYRDGVNNTTPVELGTFNSIDSYARFNQQTGKPIIYQVWDFNNNQGNGIISSVCLTSKIGGAIGYGNPSGAYRDTGWTLRSFSQDNTQWNETFDNTDTSYRFYVNSDGTVTVTEIRRISVQGSAFSGLSGSYALTPDMSYGENIKEGYAQATNVGNHKIRFVPMGSQHYNQGSTVKYYEFDTQDKTLKIKSFIVNDADGVERQIYNYWTESHSFTFTRTNKVICPSGHNGHLVIIDLSNSSFIRSSGHLVVGTQCRYEAGEMADGLIIAREVRASDSNYFTSVHYILDTSTGTFYPTNCYANETGFGNACDNKGMVEARTKAQSDTKYMFKNPLYLATINNIEPVQKDNTLTMRVMYTLEEA